MDEWEAHWIYLVLVSIGVVGAGYVLSNGSFANGWTEEFIVLLPLLIIAFIIWMIEYKQRKDEGLRPLEKFIAGVAREGRTPAEIERLLLQSGWPPQQVTEAFAAKHLPPEQPMGPVSTDPYDPLRAFIRSMTAKDSSLLIIRDYLLRAGWDEKIIDPILAEIMKKDAGAQALVWASTQNDSV